MVTQTVTQERGFSLVETLIALTILVLVLVGFLGIMRSSLNAASYAKEETTIIYLSQDIVEYIKGIRDAALSRRQSLSSSPAFVHVLSECLGSDRFCWIDTTEPHSNISSAVQRCTGGIHTCPRMQFDTTSRRYGYAGQSTPYTRAVRIEQLAPGVYRIFVHVSWNRSLTNATHSVVFDLFDLRSAVP